MESFAPGSAAVSAYGPVVHMRLRCGREQSGRAAALLWQLKEYGRMPPGSLFGKRTFSPWLSGSLYSRNCSFCRPFRRSVMNLSRQGGWGL